VDRRLGLLFVALAAIIHGSLGVTTKGVFNVATTNAYSTRCGVPSSPCWPA
jgi:hypothetical protein